jgi:hypothetical protein
MAAGIAEDVKGVVFVEAAGLDGFKGGAAHSTLWAGILGSELLIDFLLFSQGDFVEIFL